MCCISALGFFPDGVLVVAERVGVIDGAVVEHLAPSSAVWS
jgi:hypothetical protein